MSKRQDKRKSNRFPEPSFGIIDEGNAWLDAKHAIFVRLDDGLLWLVESASETISSARNAARGANECDHVVPLSKGGRAV